MNIRERDYKIGDVVFTKHCPYAYRLPEGLPEGVRVHVLGRESGTTIVLFQGKHFRISMTCVDNGRECQVNGRWEPYKLPGETKPLAKWRTG
jgi:hypothetical protein